MCFERVVCVCKSMWVNGELGHGAGGGEKTRERKPLEMNKQMKNDQHEPCWGIV